MTAADGLVAGAPLAAAAPEDGGDAFCVCAAAPLDVDVDCKTPVSALSVFGVIEGAAPLLPALTIARKAAVFGEGGGNATGPPTSGVRPVEGVRPVRNEPDGSKPKSGGCIEEADAASAATEEGFCDWPEGVDAEGCWGPASMAGERGPDRREFVMLAEERDQA